MSGRGIICAEPDDICEECQGVDELRPYGPGGKRVCYDCMEAHPEWEEEADARLANLIFGAPLPVEFGGDPPS